MAENQPVHTVDKIIEEISLCRNKGDISLEIEEKLIYATRFERLITSVSTAFINITSGGIDHEIEKTLAAVGELAGIDRSYLFQLSKDAMSVENTHEWCFPGIEPRKQSIGRLSVHEIPFQMERLKRFEPICIPHVNDLSEEAYREINLVHSQGIQSLIIVPMALQESLLGFIGVDSVRATYACTENTISLLTIVGEIFVSALERKRIENELKKSQMALERQVVLKTESLKRTNVQLEREIEKRRRAQMELEESRMYIQTIMDSAVNVAIYRVKNLAAPNRAEVVFASPSITEMLDLSDPYDFNMWFEYVHEDDLRALHETNRQSLKSKIPFDLVFRVYNPNKRIWRWLHVISVPSLDPNGKPLSYNGVIIDITEQKRSAELLRSLVNANPESLILIDTAGSILSINKTAADRFHMTVDDLVGRHIHELAQHKGFPAIRKEAEKVARTGIPVCFEQNHGGRFMETHIHPIFDIAGNVLQLAIFSLDRTERTLAVEAMKQSEQHLLALSSRLMMTEEHERKRISQELHDSLGPYLGAIKFNTEKIINQMGDTFSGPILDSLRGSIPVIQTTIDEVYRICTALRPRVLDDFGILETFSWFFREYQKIYSDITIHQRLDLREDEIPAPLKITMFRILQEALNNIAKHSKADTVWVSISRIGSRVALSIKDNGIGFEIEQVFSEGSFSTGFGLASMKERARLTGGDFTIRSVQGESTAIRVTWDC